MGFLKKVVKFPFKAIKEYSAMFTGGGGANVAEFIQGRADGMAEENQRWQEEQERRRQEWEDDDD